MRGLASLFWREVAKFGAVGGIAFVIDNGLTYYLMHGPMTDSEAKARFVGATVATSSPGLRTASGLSGTAARPTCCASS